jgi:hypothetical protein
MFQYDIFPQERALSTIVEAAQLIEQFQASMDEQVANINKDGRAAAGTVIAPVLLLWGVNSIKLVDHKR